MEIQSMTTTTARATTAARQISTHVAVGLVIGSLLLGSQAAWAQGAAEPVPGSPPVESTPPGSPPVEVAPTPSPPPAPPQPPPGALTPVAPPPAQVPSQVPSIGESMTVPPPSRIPSYILWGAAGASLIVGVSFGVAALSAKKDFDDNPTTDGADKVHNRAVISDVGLGLGAILAVTGTIFFFSADPPGEAKGAVAQVHVAPLITTNAGGGVVSMRF
jgi:hypothetical protein